MTATELIKGDTTRSSVHHKALMDLPVQNLIWNGRVSHAFAKATVELPPAKETISVHAGSVDQSVTQPSMPARVKVFRTS